MKKLNKKGFTIVELVIVIAVIAILAAVLIPTFSNVIEKANKSAAMQAARNEYEMYLAEYAKDLDGKENLYIVTEKYMFAVVNGQFSEEALTIAKDKYEDSADMSKVYVTEVVLDSVASFEANKYYTYENGKYIAVAERTVAVTNGTGSKTYYTLKDGDTSQAGVQAVDLGNDKVAIYAAKLAA